MDLEDTLIATNEICQLFAEGDRRTRMHLRSRLFTGQNLVDNLSALVKYFFENVWEYEIPEQISAVDDLHPLIGGFIRKGVELGKVEGRDTILSLSFLNYGSFCKDGGETDSHKCETVITTKDKSSRERFQVAFFSGSSTVENAVRLVQYAWEHNWSLEYPIPELLMETIVHTIVPESVYYAISGQRRDHISLLTKAIADFGILDDTKCQVYCSTRNHAQRQGLRKSFCESRNAKKNARIWLNYVLNEIVEDSFPEILTQKEVKKYGGSPFFEEFNVRNSEGLLALICPDYGILTEEKAARFIEWYGKQGSPSRNSNVGKLRRIFFGDNPLREENERAYVEAYQRTHRKRYRDLTAADFAQMPPEIRDLTHFSTPVTENRDGVEYHRINIRWTTHLEDRLRELFRECGDTLFSERQLLWDQLGVTPFSAYMKAADLGLVQEVSFGDGERLKSTPVYNLVTFPGYNNPGLILGQEEALRNQPTTELDIEGFSTPITRSGFHLQLPIEYKGISLLEYSPCEQELLRLTATYLRRPDDFLEDDQVMHYASLEEMDSPHCLVPIDVNGKLLTKIYLPRVFAQDPGAVYSCVFNTSFGQVNVFYQTEKGEVQSSVAATPV